jgi:hypothetical protein
MHILTGWELIYDLCTGSTRVTTAQACIPVRVLLLVWVVARYHTREVALEYLPRDGCRSGEMPSQLLLLLLILLLLRHVRLGGVGVVQDDDEDLCELVEFVRSVGVLDTEEFDRNPAGLLVVVQRSVRI